MPPTRVLHLLSQRPSWTGSGVALDAIVRAASRAGWEQAVVVGTPGDDPTPPVGDLPRSQVFPLLFDRPPLSFPLPGMSDVMPYSSSRFSAMSEEQLQAYREAWSSHVAAAVDRFRPDVIHSNHVWLLSSLAKDVAPDVPVVTHCHGTGLRQLELCPHLAAEVTTGCRRNNAFVVLHQGHAEQLSEHAGIDPHRIHIIGSGFRPDIFHDNGREHDVGPTVAYAGKLSNAKGVPWLLDAIERLASRVPGLQLHIAGSGSGAEADEIRARIESADNVVLHGQLDQASLADLLRRSTVFVLPSFYEGLPLVLVEAAACGCRLVATELPGVVDQLVPEIGEALELVPLPKLEGVDRPIASDLPQFVDGLGRAIETALARPHLINASELVSSMTWDGVFARIERIWNGLRA